MRQKAPHVDVPPLPERLRRARAALGLTQAAVAERLGVGLLSVKRWESGRATPNKVFVTARLQALLAEADSKPDFVLTDGDRITLLQAKSLAATRHLSAEDLRRIAEAAADEAAAAFRKTYIDSFLSLVKQERGTRT